MDPSSLRLRRDKELRNKKTKVDIVDLVDGVDVGIVNCILEIVK
jgi:hypothetical protein